MTLSTFLVVLLWLSITAYALLAGADFGAGFWDLVAGTPDRGRARRELIEHTIGPVWEANHVWLIFVLVIAWTAFPPLFAAVASTMWIPLSLVAFGIIARGSAFAFRKVVDEVSLQRLFGASFAASSVITPFFLGAVAGGIASGRVRAGLAQGGMITSWVNPTSLSCGVLAIGFCAYLSAVYLTAEARRGGLNEIAEYFRRCSLFSGAVVGAIAFATSVVAHADAGRSFGALTHRGLALTLLSVVAGLVSLGLLAVRQYVLVRVTAAIATAAVLWAWGYGQYPRLLPGLSLEQASAPHTTLQAVTISSIVGLAVLLPSLALLFALFERPRLSTESVHEEPSGDGPAVRTDAHIDTKQLEPKSPS